MKMHGQRWRYRVGNAVVNVDNAFSWIGWGQERLVVNNEPVQMAGAWFGLKRSFGEPWLTLVGEDELRVTLRSKMMGIGCAVTLADRPVEPDACFEAIWSGGKGYWPEEQVWAQTRDLKWSA